MLSYPVGAVHQVTYIDVGGLGKLFNFFLNAAQFQFQQVGKKYNKKKKTPLKLHYVKSFSFHLKIHLH